MRRGMPSLNALRVFERAARRMSFAMAADELGVTPGAVSRHIRLLEQEVGLPLFQRLPRSVVLTQEGHELLRVVSDSFDRLELGTRFISKPNLRSRLLINVQTTLATGWMLARLERFCLANPTVELELSTHLENPDLHNGPTDAAVVHGRGPSPDLSSDFLFGDRLQPVCAPGYLAARGLASAEPIDLLSQTLLISRTAPDDWHDWFVHVGFTGKTPQPTMVFGSSLLPVQAALHGLGVALADISLIRDHLDANRLVVLAGMPPLVRGTGYYLAYSPARRASPAMLAFRDWLITEAASGSRMAETRQDHTNLDSLALLGAGEMNARALDQRDDQKLISTAGFAVSIP